MNAEISAHGLVPIGNLLVVEDNGNVWSRTVSQVYGRAILGAMALRLNRLPFRVLHESNLSQHETLTLDNVRKAAQAVAPSDNFIFINDSRRILSCQVNSNYGVALLKSLQQQTPEEGSQTQPVLSHANAIQASDNDNNRDIAMESYEYASQDLEQPYANGSSSSQKTSAASLEILSDKILSSANRQPYDRDWMERYNISDDYLNGSVSKHRLDVIVNHGAVKVGDKLCVTYDPDGGPVAGFGEVLQSSKSGRLDLRIAPRRADFDGILYDCKTPKDIIVGMDKEFQLRRDSKLSEAWKLVNVVSVDGREIGSLWKVRQAYQVFTEEMAEWGSHNRQNSP